MADKAPESPKTPGCDAYFEKIQSRKKLPFTLQEALTNAFANIPVSSFPQVPGGKRHTNCRSCENSLRTKYHLYYLGIMDYSAIILWVLENSEIAAVALSAGSATAAGVGVGALGAIGPLALGATGPVAAAGLTVAAVGAAIAEGMVAERGAGRDAPTAAGQLGEDFYSYKVIVQEEPLKSAAVSHTHGEGAMDLVLKDRLLEGVSVVISINQAFAFDLPNGIYDAKLRRPNPLFLTIYHQKRPPIF
ncbi:hypothetical protein EJ110_NYTH32987 [Nymphaea thermarum]|nr:hypothetical protein EJ110_NYTH32987 [Nymphaea thermarum]